MRASLAAALSMLLPAFLAGEPPPDLAIDWSRVATGIESRWAAVRSVTYDSQDDFVIIVVADGTAESEAAAESCSSVEPTILEAGSRALFAIYTESGAILSSWNRCLPTPPGGP